MTDIVERLRTWGSKECTGNAVALGAVREAADEIERLRAGGCARDQRTTQWCAEAAAEIKRLRTELEQWTTWGVIEVAVRNPSVSEYMRYWEGRATKAEAELAALRADAERYRYIRDNHEVRGRAMEIVYGMNGSDWDAAIDAARPSLPRA